MTTHTTKHTPGPWVVDRENGIVGPNGNLLFVSCGPVAQGKQTANAHLIAAAPAMYEALKAMCKEWNRHGCCDSRGVYEQAERAIAAAEGRQ